MDKKEKDFIDDIKEKKDRAENILKGWATLSIESNWLVVKEALENLIEQYDEVIIEETKPNKERTEIKDI